MPVRIGELLLKEKRITADQLQQALNHQKAGGGKLGYNLVKMGVIKPIPADTAQKYQIVPLSRAGAPLTIAMTDPPNVFAMDDIKFMTGYNVEPVVASETAIMESIEKYYGSVHSLQIKEEMDKLVETDDFKEDVEGPGEGDGV